MADKILITGANSGIGYFLALSLLKKQHKIAVLDVRTDQIMKLTKEFGENLLVFCCDITDEDSVRKNIQQILIFWDTIDIVVNNACKAVFLPFDKTTSWEIEEAFRVNVYGMLNVIRSVLPVMLEMNRGVIHNMSSGVGITGFRNLLGYASSKGAVEILTRCLALEYVDTNICFNIIHPPLTATPSASPIGLPASMLEEPEKVGERLSELIGSRKMVITTGWKSAVGIRMMKLFPYFMGKLFSNATRKHQKLTET